MEAFGSVKTVERDAQEVIDTLKKDSSKAKNNGCVRKEAFRLRKRVEYFNLYSFSLTFALASQFHI